MSLRDDRGAGSVEWAGGTLLVAGVVAAGIAATQTDAGDLLGSQVSHKVCESFATLGVGDGCTPPDAAPVTTTQDAQDEEVPYRDRDWTYQEVTDGDAVMIGDSYGSGEGAGDYEDGTDEDGEPSLWDRVRRQDPPPHNMCHRSGNAWFPSIGDHFDDATFVACSGSTTSDYWEDDGQHHGESAQRDALDEDVSMTFVSMGGNDMQFADVVRSCVERIEMGSACIDHWDGPDPDDPNLSRFEANLQALRADLDAMFEDIVQQTDEGHVVVMGYPALFEDDYGGIISNEAALWMNDKSVVLNSMIAEVAEENGVHFIDPTEAFDGHGIGSDDPWILTYGWWGDHRAKPPESYHPTADGQAAMADLVDDYLNSLPRQ